MPATKNLLILCLRLLLARSGNGKSQSSSDPIACDEDALSAIDPRRGVRDLQRKKRLRGRGAAVSSGSQHGDGLEELEPTDRDDAIHRASALLLPFSSSSSDANRSSAIPHRSSSVNGSVGNSPVRRIRDTTTACCSMGSSLSKDSRILLAFSVMVHLGHHYNPKSAASRARHERFASAGWRQTRCLKETPDRQLGCILATPVMGIALLGGRPHWTSPLCEIGISWRSA